MNFSYKLFITQITWLANCASHKTGAPLGVHLTCQVRKLGIYVQGVRSF